MFCSTIKKFALKQANSSTVAKTYKHTPRKPVTIFRQTSLNFAKFQQILTNYRFENIHRFTRRQKVKQNNKIFCLNSVEEAKFVKKNSLFCLEVRPTFRQQNSENTSKFGQKKS